MVYVGIDSDIVLGRVRQQDDENLGGAFKFRRSLAVAYAFDNGSRLGVRFGHISRADIHQQNPSENDLMVAYGMLLVL
jgi:lipid A 3-O-deacylase